MKLNKYSQVFEDKKTKIIVCRHLITVVIAQLSATPIPLTTDHPPTHTKHPSRHQTQPENGGLRKLTIP